jgi:signal transduction histidine kinase
MGTWRNDQIAIGAGYPGDSMSTRRITKERSFWNRRGRIIGSSSFSGALWPSLIAGVCLPIFLLILPSTWLRTQIRSYQRDWAREAISLAEAIEWRWREPLVVKRLQNGVEADIVDTLRAHPLVRAVANIEDGRLWIRKDDHLELAGNGAEPETYRRWIQSALASGRYEWKPASFENPHPTRDAVGVFRQDPWVSIRVWRVGSPEVEEHLRISAGYPARIRVGLRPARATGPFQAESASSGWGDPSNIQVDLSRRPHSRFSGLINSAAFEPEWTLVCMEPEKEEAELNQLIRLWRVEAYGASVLLSLALWTGLFLWRRNRLAERIDRDRLASMAHSLKTPLGLIKMRCETCIYGDPPDTTAMTAGFLRIAEDVDHLTLFINDSLRGLSKADTPREMQDIGQAWFHRVVEDLRPAFEVDSRDLKVELAEATLKADGTLLKTALVTLIENALNYGTGEVLFRTSKTRSTLKVEVQNHGGGLTKPQLQRLASPYTRFRQQGQEGFTHEGRGLGLFLLAQMAALEGWGLSITTAPGRGFTACLELPLA